MSIVSFIIKEAKIVNTAYNQPREVKNQDGTFKCLNFLIMPSLSIKNQNTESGWDTKCLPIRCTIWNDKTAMRFLKVFDPDEHNYITILSSQLNNFTVDEMEKISKDGNPYLEKVYSYFSITVNDFLITIKHFDGENPYDNAYSDRLASDVSEVNDNIPF